MQTDVLALTDAGALEYSTAVFGGVVLNESVGGLNPWAVDLALTLGGKVV